MFVTLIAAIAMLGPHQVVQLGNYRLASIEGADGETDVLALSHDLQGRLQIRRLSPRDGTTLWLQQSLPDPVSPSGALCAIPDQDGDGRQDWALTFKRKSEKLTRDAGVVLIGSGLKGEVIRRSSIEGLSPELSICYGSSGTERVLVLGAPFGGAGSGQVTWVRTSDLALCKKLQPPPDVRGFGWCVAWGDSIRDTLLLSAPQSSVGAQLWNSTDLGVAAPMSEIAITRSGHEELLLGSSIAALANNKGPSLTALGASGLNTTQQGIVLIGSLSKWREAWSAQGKETMFGSCFGYAVLAVDDLDEDGVSDLIVSDPALNLSTRVEESGPAGGCYMVQTRQKQTQLLCTGKTSLARLGTSLALLGDLDSDGFREIAILAPGTTTLQDGCVAIWSVKKRQQVSCMYLK